MKPLAVVAVIAAAALPVRAAITGSVVDAAGAAVADVRIEAYRPVQQYYEMTMATKFVAPQPLATSTTDAKGGFTINLPGHGVVDVHATAAGYAPSDTFSAYDDTVTITLRKAASVTGTVTAAGKPVSDATVFAFPQNGVPTSVKTDKSGAYSLPDPRTWAQFILVSHPDFAPAAHPAMSPSFNLEPGREVRGKVVDEKDAPVANAEVVIQGASYGKTADNGTFAIAHVPPQARTISAKSAAGAASMLLPSGSPTLRLRKTVHVTGVVRDASKQPLANIAVAGGDEQGYDLGYTDAKGAFSLNLPRGQFTISPSGFDVYEIDEASADGRNGDVRHDFEAKRARFISGIVKLADGSPVAGAAIGMRPVVESVRDYPVEPPAFFGDVRTTAGGRFRIRGIGAEKFKIVALKRGLPPAESQPLTEDAADRAVTITIPDGVEIRGTVVDPDRQPLAGVVIDPIPSLGGDHDMSMQQQPDRRDPWTVTGEDGSFKARLARGSAVLSFAKKGYLSAQQLIEVAPGMPPIAISLQRGASLRGRVVKKDGSPAPDAVVMLAEKYAMTDPDGAFAIEDIESGDYVVQYGGSGGMLHKNVHVPDDDVRLVLGGTHQITGRVTDAATSAPIEQFTVWIRGNEDDVRSPVPISSPTGEFSVDTAEGPAKMSVAAEGYATAKGIAVTESSNAPFTIALSRGRTIRGRVMDGSGQALADVDIAVSAPVEDLNTGRQPRSEANGSFEYTGIGFDDDVTISFSKEGFVPEQRKVAPSHDDARLDVSMKRGIAVTGHVIDASGNGAADISVDASSATHGAGYQSAQTDQNGAFQFAGLAPGRYDFSAQTPSALKGALKDVDIEKQHDITIRLEKSATALITGHVSGLDPSSIVRVAMATNESEDSASAPIDASGNFRIQAPAGIVEVQAHMSSRRGSRETRAVSVEAPPNSERRVELEFVDQVKLRGVVTRGGVPAPGVMLRFDGGGAGNASTPTTLEGAYETLIDPGEYDVTAFQAERKIPFTQHISVASDAQIDFRIDTSSVRVMVIDAASEQPLEGASVNLMHRSGTHSVATAQTGADGSVTLEIPRAEPLVVSASRRGYANAVADLPEAPASPVVLRLAASSGAVVRLVDRRDGRTLTGYVIARDEAGRVLASSYEADPDGTVTLPVPAGQYRFSGSADGYGSQTVTAATSGGEVRIALPRGGAIALRSSTPVSATARLVQPNGDEYVRCWCNGIATIEINGRTTLVDRIAPGPYTLELTIAGAKPRAIPVTVVEGQTLAVSID